MIGFLHAVTVSNSPWEFLLSIVSYVSIHAGGNARLETMEGN